MLLAKTFVIFCLCVCFTALVADPEATIIEDSDYTFVRGEKVNWDSARKACLAQDKQLLNIETEEKWLEIKAIIMEHEFNKLPNWAKYDWYTVGWVDAKLEETPEGNLYRWKNGDLLHHEKKDGRASYWNMDQPDVSKWTDAKNNTFKEECLSIDARPNRTEERYRLGINDWHCYEKAFYICEESDNNYPESTCD